MNVGQHLQYSNNGASKCLAKLVARLAALLIIVCFLEIQNSFALFSQGLLLNIFERSVEMLNTQCNFEERK